MWNHSDWLMVRTQSVFVEGRKEASKQDCTFPTAVDEDFVIALLLTDALLLSSLPSIMCSSLGNFNYLFSPPRIF